MCVDAGMAAGASHATPHQLLAGVLESTAQIMLGAVSPKLIFQGCLREGITARQVVDLMVHEPKRVEELQWT